MSGSHSIRFTDKLRNLGFQSYDAYLASPHWKSFRAAYKASGKPWVCAVCGRGKAIHLHHLDYERLGAELVADVVPLCGGHHKLVHLILKQRNWLVDQTLHVIGTIRCKKVKKKPGKRKRPRSRCQFCGRPAKRHKALCKGCKRRGRTPPVQEASEPICRNLERQLVD